MAKRRIPQFTAEQKLKIVKEGLLHSVRVADLCRIHPVKYIFRGAEPVVNLSVFSSSPREDPPMPCLGDRQCAR